MLRFYAFNSFLSARKNNYDIYKLLCGYCTIDINMQWDHILKILFLYHSNLNF